MIEITQKAAEQIKTILAHEESPASGGGLRITVEGGGCSGRQYALSFDARRPDDEVFHQHEVNVLIDPASLAYLKGSVIDYADGLNGAGFRIRNPNAKQTCGCGSSFEA